MKKTYSKSSRQGLPGGPNEMFEKVKGIIVSQRGQWDFPGMNTLVPTDDGRITMRGVPYPVYGQDETGYGQMMYPGQEYQFPGNNVLELPMAQVGLENNNIEPIIRLNEYDFYDNALSINERLANTAKKLYQEGYDVSRPAAGGKEKIESYLYEVMNPNLEKRYYTNTCVKGVCDVFKRAEINSGIPEDVLDNDTFFKNYNKYGFDLITDKKDLQPGDIIQYYNDKRPYHMGIYIGNNEYISDGSSDKPFTKSNIYYYDDEPSRNKDNFRVFRKIDSKKQLGGSLPRFQNGNQVPAQSEPEPEPFTLPKGKGYYFKEDGETNLPKKMESIEKRNLRFYDFETEEDYINFLTSEKSKNKDFGCKEDNCAEFANNRAGELVGLSGADLSTWLRGGKYKIGVGGNAWQTYGNILDLGGKSIFNNYKNQGDVSQVKPGDIIGLKKWSVYNHSGRYSIRGENAPKAGVDNSHQGVVEYVDKKGNIYIRHNVHGSTSVKKLTNKNNKYYLGDTSWQIVTAARPNFEKYQYADIDYKPEIGQYYVKPFISDYNPNEEIIFKQDVVKQADPHRYKTRYGNFMAGEAAQKEDWLTGQLNIQGIPVTERAGNEDMQKFVNSLNDNKEKLMHYYHLKNDEFNEIAKYALATAGAESDFGTSSKLKTKESYPELTRLVKSIKDVKTYPSDEMSRGIGQVKLYSLDDIFKQIFGVTKRNISKPEYNALAVFSHLADDIRKVKNWSKKNTGLPEEVQNNYPFLATAAYVNPYTVAAGNLSYDPSFQNDPNKPYEPIGLDNKRLRIISDYIKDVGILNTKNPFAGQKLKEFRVVPEQQLGGSLPTAQMGMLTGCGPTNTSSCGAPPDPCRGYAPGAGVNYKGMPKNVAQQLARSSGCSNIMTWWSQKNPTPSAITTSKPSPNIRKVYKKILTPIVQEPKPVNEIETAKEKQQEKDIKDFSKYRNIVQAPIQLGPNQYEDRIRLITPLHEYMMNLDQYSKLLPTDSIPQQGNFLYRLNRQQLGGALPQFQNTGQFNPKLFKPNPITGLYNWEKPRVKPKLSDFEPKQKAAPRSSTSVATKQDPVKAARQINSVAAEEYERNRQGVIRATNRPVSVFRPGAGNPEAIMEFIGVPGTVRFVKNPVQGLKGTGNTIVDLGMTIGPLANMNPTAALKYTTQGINPLTGEGSFRPQDVEGAFNTLDAAGLATIAGAGLKAPLQASIKAPLQQGVKQLAKSPVVDYAKEFGHSIKKGKLPTYESIYRWQPDVFPERLVEAGKTLTPLQQTLTGSWYTKYPGQLAFYMRSRPGAGNVNRIRLSDRQIANLESSMPDYAKGMSGKSGVNRVPTSNTFMPGELIVPESIRSKSVPMRFQINPIDYSPQSVADKIAKQRSKLKNLLNNPYFLPDDIDRTIRNEVIEEHAKDIYIPMLKAQEQPILGIPRKYFPFEDGGSLPTAQRLGEFNPKLFKPNPLTGRYNWEDKKRNTILTNPNIPKIPVKSIPKKEIGNHWVKNWQAPDSFAENFLEVVDPTGYLSYDDARRADSTFKASGRTYPTFGETLDMSGVLPGYLGRIKNFRRLRYPLNLINRIDAGTDIVDDNLDKNLPKNVTFRVYPYKKGGSLPRAQNGDEIFPGEGQYYNIPEYTYNYKRGFDDLPDPVYSGPLMNQRLIDEATQREYEQRRRAIEESVAAAREPLSAQRLARESAATGDKFSLQMNLGDPYNNPRLYETLGALDFINPGVMLGDMVTGLGSIPYNVQEGNYGAATFGLGLPLATGALASIGVKTPRQFVNNLVNPVAGIGDTPKQLPGSSNVVNISENQNFLTDLFKPKSKNINSNFNFDKIPERKFTPLDDFKTNYKSEYNVENPSRTFHGKKLNIEGEESNFLTRSIDDKIEKHYNNEITFQKFKDYGGDESSYQRLIDNINTPSKTVSSGVDVGLLTDEGVSLAVHNKYLDPAETRSTLFHEKAHQSKVVASKREDSLLPKLWDDINELTGYTKNYTDADKGSIGMYLNSPTEVYSRIMELKYKAGLKPYENFTKELLEKTGEVIRDSNGKIIRMSGIMPPNYSKNADKWLKLINKAPVIIPPAAVIGAGAYGVNQMQDAQPMQRFGGNLNFQEGGDCGDYNMQRALELGYTPDEAGHYPSVDSETVMWLKSKQHPTAWMESMYGYQLNPEVYNNYNVTYNPEGYFGENQLQYVPKKFGGSLPTAVDPVLNFIQSQSHRFSKSKK